MKERLTHSNPSPNPFNYRQTLWLFGLARSLLDEAQCYIIGDWRIVVTSKYGVIILADLSLMNDRVTSFPVHAANYSDQVEPFPSGDTLTATSDNPALGVSVVTDGNGNVSVMFKPASGFPTATGVKVTLTDSTGLTPWSRVVDLTRLCRPTHC